MAQIPSKISRQNFQKMLKRSGEGFVRKSVMDAIKKSGDPYVRKLAYGSTASKAASIRAVKMLREKGLLKTSKTPTTLYRQAGLRQVTDDEAARHATMNPHVRAAIRGDVVRELEEEERGNDTMQYDPRSVLGKAMIDEINRSKAGRDKKVATEKQKHEQLLKSKSAKTEKPIMVDESKLPNIDIG